MVATLEVELIIQNVLLFFNNIYLKFNSLRYFLWVGSAFLHVQY
jgi:hypothetical protein